jgi:hypothetical protein
MLGINRKVQPLEHLEVRHRDFQKRMVLCAPLPSDAPSSPPRETAATASSSKRAVLGETKKSKSKTSAASLPAAPAQEDVFTAQAAARRPGPNARMQVFVDPSGEQSAAAGPSVWADAGTRTSRVKENVKEVSKFKGTAIKQKPAAVARTASGSAGPGGFTIFRDPEPGDAAGEMAMPPPPVPAKAVPKTPSHRKGAIVPSTGDESGVPSTPGSSFTVFRDEVRFVPLIISIDALLMRGSCYPRPRHRREQ